MTPDLDAFLARAAAQPWAWGFVDCVMTLADWVMANGHTDPADRYRGAYDSEDSWRALAERRNGMCPIVAECLDPVGFARVDRPARGVIAVIGARRHPCRQWGAIHDGARWQVRTAFGFTPMTAQALGMWRI